MIVTSGPGFCDILVMVDHMPLAGALADSRQTLELPGGGAPATAAWASRLGEPAAVVTCLGGATGSALREALVAVEVADEPLAGDTVRCLVLITADGERTMVNLDPVPAPGEVPREAHNLLAAAIVCWSDWPDEATAAAVDGATRAEHRGAPLRLLQRELAGGRRHQIVIGSERDGISPSDDELGRAGCLLCVITDGARGGRYWEPQSGWSRFAPEPLPGTFVDSCGAGDAFTAGVLVGIARGLTGAGAVALGAQAAAACCCRPGSFPA